MSSNWNCLLGLIFLGITLNSASSNTDDSIEFSPFMTVAFAEATLEPKSSASLKCAAGGKPTPVITWEIYENQISNGDRHRIRQYIEENGDIVSYLNISSIRSIDGGIYKCKATNKIGTAEHSSRVNVHGMPYVRRMAKKTITAGETLMLTCPFSGYPIDLVMWERDYKQLPRNERQTVYPNGTMTIEFAERISDAGTYTCVARNPEGYLARNSVDVQILSAPEIVPFKSSIERLKIGDRMNVQCKIRKGDRPLVFEWKFNEQPITKDADNVTIGRFSSQTSILNIDYVTTNHRGVYKCVVSNSVGSSFDEVELIVKEPPNWVIKPNNQNVDLDSDVRVGCQALGVPKENAMWFKEVELNEHMRLANVDDSRIRVEDGQLVIDDFQTDDEGNYRCSVVNDDGERLDADFAIGVNLVLVEDIFQEEEEGSTE